MSEKYDKGVAILYRMERDVAKCKGDELALNSYEWPVIYGFVNVYSFVK